MRILIVDDEKKARNLLRVLVEENVDSVEEIREAPDLTTAVEIIREFNPAIVFLDIEMPGHSGIQILEFFEPEEVTFEIVFTTAYNEYAIKAFELNAVDYLLKPIRGHQIEAAVKKAQERKGLGKLDARLRELQQSLKSNRFNKIGLPLSDGILFVNLDDIILFEADRMYTKVHTTTDGEILVSKPMKFFLDNLETESSFYRPHRSFLINLHHIKRYSSQDGGYILMDNEATVSISKDKREEFKRIMAL